MATEKRVETDIEAYVIGEDFRSYFLHFERYLKYNKVKDEDKAALLLLKIGSEPLKEIEAQLSPMNIDDATYDQIVTACKKCFIGEKNEVCETYYFNNRSQNECESIREYAVALKLKAEHCNFEDSLDRSLRDRFIAGINDSSIIKELLKMDKPKFQDVVDKAHKMEQDAKGKSENVHLTFLSHLLRGDSFVQKKIT